MKDDTVWINNGYHKSKEKHKKNGDRKIYKKKITERNTNMRHYLKKMVREGIRWNRIRTLKIKKKL